MKLMFNVGAEQLDLANKFSETYDLVNAILPAEPNNTALKPKLQRRCRFCGRSMPDVKFNSDAHLIPEFLGNKVLLSDFECDSCNQLFSEYEDQFAKSIGPFRTLYALQGKGNKFPTFKSPKGAVRMEVQDFHKNQIVQISRPDVENEDFSYNAETGEMKIKYRKHPYSLQKVYKFFTKLALSVIPEVEAESDYQLAKRFLLNSLQVQSGCIVTGYQLQFPVKFPTHVFLFKKREPKAKTFTHVIALYTLNYIIAVPVILNKNDLWFYGEKLRAFEFPLMTLLNIDFQNTWSSKFCDDFSSDVPITGKEEEITFAFDKKDLAQAVAINPKTGEPISDYQFGTVPIKKIVMGTGEELKIDLNDIK